MLRRQSSVAEEEAPVTSKTEDEVFSFDKNDNKAPKSEISETGSDIAAQSESENVPKVDVDFATPVKPRGSVVSAHDISATLYGTPEEQKNRPLHLDETSGGKKFSVSSLNPKIILKIEISHPITGFWITRKCPKVEWLVFKTRFFVGRVHRIAIQFTVQKWNGWSHFLFTIVVKPFKQSGFLMVFRL
jgi:hypothetical protein